MSDKKTDDQNSGKKDDKGTEQNAKTFTQEEVDRIVGERVARAKPADYDDLKAKAERLDEIEAEQASDLEKAVKAAREEVEQEVTKRFLAERVADKIEVAATGKFHDVEDARLRLGSRVDDFVNADGSVDADAIASAVEKILEDHPHLKKSEERGTPRREDVGLGSKGGGGERRNVKPGLSRLEVAYSDG